MQAHTGEYVVHGFLTVNVLLLLDPDGTRYARKMEHESCDGNTSAWKGYAERLL